MNGLGVLLKDQGDLTQAEGWLRGGAEAGCAYAMYNLAVLLSEHGDVTEAGSWARRAFQTGESELEEQLTALFKTLVLRPATTFEFLGDIVEGVVDVLFDN